MDTHEQPQTWEKQATPITHVESITSPTAKRTASGIVLVPQPSDDIRDPLNWPLWKKCLNLGIITFAAFAGALCTLANTSGFFVQAALYGVTPVQMSYGTSAGIAGLVVGPFVFSPLARKVGRSSLVFWGMLVTMGTSIWGASCTGKGDYISFVMSRFMSGLFGSVATTIGAGIILEVFYLHQRGKAFTFYSVSLLVGTIAAPTFSGFIVTYVDWPVQFWYNVGLEAFIAILAFFFLEETGFIRGNGPAQPTVPQTWLQTRMAVLTFRQKVVPTRSWSEIFAVASSQFVILVAPVVVLCGGYLSVMFGWAVSVNTLQSVFLQTPVAVGGYGFTPLQNSYFLFTNWIALIFSQLYGQFLTDRLPIYLCKKFGRGVWKPEYRLHSLWLPGLFLQPIGLGVFGAALHFHYHPAAVAVGAFLINVSAISAVPILDTYVAECFTTRAAEANACMNAWRLVFGIAVPFFVEPWIAAVGLNWVFGMMAFFSIFVFALLVLLMIKGHAIRHATLGHVAADEEGTKLARTNTMEEA